MKKVTSVRLTVVPLVGLLSGCSRSSATETTAQTEAPFETASSDLNQTFKKKIFRLI